MELIEKKQDEIFIFNAKGRIDSNTSPYFEKKIVEAAQNGSKKILLDFAELNYISSAGLRIILKAARLSKRNGGTIILCSLKDYVMEVFEIAGFDSIFTIVSSVEEAIEHF